MWTRSIQSKQIKGVFWDVETETFSPSGLGGSAIQQEIRNLGDHQGSTNQGQSQQKRAQGELQGNTVP